MSNLIRNLWLLIAGIGLLFINGCALYPRGIGIYEVPSFEKKFVKSNSFYDYIVSINEKEKTFYTLQPDINGVILSLISFDGEIKSKEIINLSFPSYRIKTSFALSENGERIAYYDSKTKNLYLHDIRSSEKKTLLEKDSFNGESLEKITFLNHDKLLIIMLDYQTNEGSLVFLNVTNSKVVTSRSFINGALPKLPSDFKLSSNKELLAFMDWNDYDGKFCSRISVYNLILFDELLYIQSDFWGSYSFSPDEKTLGFIKDNCITLYSFDTKQITKFKQLPKGSSCYHMDFLDNNTIVYLTQKLGGGLSSTQNIITLNIQTGKEMKSPTIPINGDIYVVDGGKKILCEEGY